MSNVKSEGSGQRLEAGNQKSEIGSRRSEDRDPQSEIRNPQLKECYCYIVECADGTLYTGWTTDLQRRVAAHNAGRGSQYTRSRRPVKLVYFERLPDRAQAMRREIRLKRLPRSAKLDLVVHFKRE
jgi:putative endonuclease